jgi:hypothetical protein
LTDLKRGRQRFDENGLVIGNAIGNCVQVMLRHADEFGKGAVVTINADDGSPVTVVFQPTLAAGALATIAIDFADHAASGQRSGLGHAHEFVPQDAAKLHVAACQLQIGFADTGLQDLHQNFAILGLGNVKVVAKYYFAAVKCDRLHGRACLCRGQWMGTWINVPDIDIVLGICDMAMGVGRFEA